jgi:hypothetical protein
VVNDKRMFTASQRVGGEARIGATPGAYSRHMQVVGPDLGHEGPIWV